MVLKLFYAVKCYNASLWIYTLKKKAGLPTKGIPKASEI